jgi:hypothetical protein
MSFSYKTLNSNDIALTSYIANKQWEVTDATLSQNGVTIYIGENLPINKTNPFDSINDSQTENEEYRRLIFDSIKNLYYQNYVSGTLSGQFYQSSSFFNYEQSTIVSGTIRNLPTITGSSAIGNNPTLFGTSLYDISSSLYDQTSFDPDKGSKIVVISIDQKIFGSGLSPNTVIISGSTYNLQDDGEGNIMDTLTSTYVGNVFYSQGLIVITNQDYLCVFGAPPTTTNDYFSYLNVNYNPQVLDILANDFADCGVLNQTSVQIYSVPGFSFPNYTLSNGLITITPNQSSIIPGNYQLNYTVGNLNGIRSNTSSISLTVTSQSLQVTNIITSSVCYASTASIPVTFSINYGVPPYSYSLDNGAHYTGVPGFFNQTVSGSMTASLNSIIYVKDYMGTIATASFTSWYSPVTYTTLLTKKPCSSTDNSGKFTVDNTGGYTGVSASFVLTGSADSYYALPKQFTALSTGSYTLKVKDSHGCVTSSLVILGVYPALTSSATQSNVSCYGASNGSISVAFTNVTDTLIVNMLNTAGTGSYIYSSINLSDFPNNTVTASNLVSGSYSLVLSSIGANQCQSYNNTFTITSPTTPTFVTTASYINSCSNAIIFSGSGGTSPYTYYAVETSSNTIYSSNSSSVALNGLNGGTFNTYIVDSNGCISTSSLVTTYGRTYNYTGSYCVLTGSNNTGYISSSGIQQNFTTGPYSGSLVTSSYSSGSILLGPTVNFKQLFTSGTVDSIIACNVNYSRYYYNAAICPPGGCYAPILVTATPLYCGTSNWTSSYSVTYNSGSSLATTTIIEYSYNSSFSPKVTHSINNASPSMTPFSTITDFGLFNTQDQIMYFRAYNSCSIGTTSSYSNVLTASCVTAPPTPTFTVKIKNHSGVSLKYSTGSALYSVSNNQSASVSFTSQTKDINLYTINGVHSSGVGNEYTVNVSSSLDVNNNVYTVLHCPIDSINYPDYTVISEYIDGGYDFGFIDDTSNNTPDLSVHIDRNTYTNSGTITLDIKPFL